MNSLVGYLLQVTCILLVFGAIAALLVRLGRRSPGRNSGPLELVARLPLEGRRVVYLVRAGERLLVVGGSDAGLTRLGELEASAAELGAPLLAEQDTGSGSGGPDARGALRALRDAVLGKALER
jgi:flagellar biogenesis protein FliO